MGGQDFETKTKGATAQEAFEEAQHKARYDHGHAGYTGTIAEKHEFVMVTVPTGKTVDEYLESLASDHSGKNPYNDKWGPAGCIKVADDEWLFFGSASS